MNKGVILYITEGREEMHQDWPDLKETCRFLGVKTVRLATSEDEIAYGWWEMLTRGIQQISCMRAAYDGGSDRFEPVGAPLRLCG
jgi:hypothetical protein